MKNLLANEFCSVENIDNNSNMVHVSQIDTIRKKILPVLLPFGFRKIALFGSMARDELTPTSDIDILVTLKPASQRKPIGLKWFGLERDLGRLLNRKVDLVEETTLSPYIRPYVEEDLVILYEEK